MTGSNPQRPRPFGSARYAIWLLCLLAGYGAWLHAQEAEPDAAPEVNIAAPDSVVTDSTDAPGDDSAQDGVAQENEAADNPELSEPSPEEQDAGSSAGGGTVTLLKIQGAIGPATADFVSRGIESAETAGASLIVLEMDTPGGLDTAMREIIQAILASSIPVTTYVSPQGARAASAGTYILYASHIAAMAPATNLGAATPVAIGGPAPASPTDTADEDEEEQAASDEASSEQEDSGENGGEGDSSEPVDADAEAADDDGDEAEPSELIPQPSTATERKAINDAVAYIRSLAELRGRNADWAEAAVRAAESLSSQDALEMNVIDLIADDLADLMQQLDGWQVQINGRDVELDTTGLIYERIEPDWRTRFLEVISNPTVAYMLMLLGIYGLIFEGYNPGAIVPGVVGAISILLALFAFQVLPINYAGLALIVLGVILMVSEFLVPSFGALGMGGIAAFVFGSVILIDSDVPGFGVSIPLIAALALSGAVILLGIVWFAVKSRDRPVVSGAEELVGAHAEALADFTTRGQIWVHGERWAARTDTPVTQGQSLEVVKVDGLTLQVKPKDSS